MPFEDFVDTVDRQYAGPAHFASSKTGLAQDGGRSWLSPAPAFAGNEAIRYATELRLQLRERYPDAPRPPVCAWCIDAD